MKKKIKAVLLACALTVCTIIGSVGMGTVRTSAAEQMYVYRNDGWYYIENDNGITLVGYYGNETDVVIPEQIDNKTVTDILGFLSFLDIGDAGAMYGDDDAVENIHSIKIPKTIAHIGDFRDAINLQKITVDVENPYYETDAADALYNKGKTTLIWYPRGKTQITIPEGVTSIGDEIFYDYSELESIDLPEGLTSIGERAFGGCESLRDIRFPTTLTSIGEWAFVSSGLTDVNIPGGVTDIKSFVFQDCRSLQTVNIPEGVTNIGDQAFFRCSSLRDIQFPTTLTSIGRYAFLESGLENISIPGGVISIGSSAFLGCDYLNNVTLSEGITSIGEGAFSGCSRLTGIVIPSSVSDIGESAFPDVLL